jgi:hypothetical protein
VSCYNRKPYKQNKETYSQSCQKAVKISFSHVSLGTFARSFCSLFNVLLRKVSSNCFSQWHVTQTASLARYTHSITRTLHRQHHSHVTHTASLARYTHSITRTLHTQHHSVPGRHSSSSIPETKRMFPNVFKAGIFPTVR